MQDPAKLQPAIFAGLAIGVLSALPIINIGNLCCCAWVLFGGGLAAYLMQQNHPAPINAGDAAIVGLLAGLVGAVVNLAISIPLAFALEPFQATMVERVLQSARDLPPEAREFLERMRGENMIAAGMVFMFIARLFMYTIAGLIGGLLGMVVFRSNVAPPPPPPPPPPIAPPPPPPLPPDVPTV